jgi:hypothetical protein
MADDGAHGVAPSLYPEMKALAATVLKLCGFPRLTAMMQDIVFDTLNEKGEFFNRPNPVTIIDDLFPIFSGPKNQMIYEPFNYLSNQELDFLRRISSNGRVTCKLLKNGSSNDFYFSLIVRIPVQPQIPNSQTINCEIEYHMNFDEKFEDALKVDLVTWFDETIDEKLVRRARTSYALMTGM